MDEIENRFEIIRIAVGLADYETIETQIRRLRNVSTDKHLHEILQELENKNFRQAFHLMRDYADSLRDDFFSPTLSDNTVPTHAEPAFEKPAAPSPIEKDLFSPPSLSPEPTKEDDRMLGLEEMLQMTKESAPAPHHYEEKSQEAQAEPKEEPISLPATEPDPLFTLDQEISTPEAATLHGADNHADTKEQEEVDEISEETSVLAAEEMTPLFGGGDELDDDFLSFAPVKQEETVELAKEELSETTALAQNEGSSSMFDLDEPEHEAIETESDLRDDHIPSPAVPSQEASEELTNSAEMEQVSEEELPAAPELSSAVPPLPRSWEMEPDEEEERYEKFAYMGQKFRNMMHQYPQLEEYEEGIMDEVSSFIHMVSTHDYAESQVEAAVERYQELKGEGQRAEAAQMLIAAATTESTFAQFMLARELFKGEVLQQNYPESFTQINRLAEEDYAEAICDLGQLYEYGIGIDKNKRHALLLYEEAAEMGVDRAQSHYDRLKSSNPIQSIKSLTSSLLRKKK